MANRHSARRMRAALSRREREGLSWAGLSACTGIAVSTLQSWKRKLESAGDGGAPEFVELVVDGRSGRLSEQAGAWFELVLSSGELVRVPQQFDAVALADLLAVLEARAC